MKANDEKFLKNWPATQAKGKRAFLIKGALCGVVIALLSELFAKYELSYAEIFLSYQLLFKIAVYALGVAAFFFYTWKQNNKRYNSLLEEANSQGETAA